MADLLDSAEDMQDDDATGGGIFQQPTDTFNHEVRQDVQNPQVVRAQEQVPENLPGTPAPEPVRDLAFVQDTQGRLMCAFVVNGNQVEAFREPTEAERALAPKARWQQTPYAQQQQMQAQQARLPAPQQVIPRAVGVMPFGQSLQRGMGQVAQPMPPPPQQGMSVGKMLLVGGVVLGGGYLAYKWAKEEGILASDSDDDEDETEEEATQRELDEADDVDEETEV